MNNNKDNNRNQEIRTPYATPTPTTHNNWVLSGWAFLYLCEKEVNLTGDKRSEWEFLLTHYYHLLLTNLHLNNLQAHVDWVKEGVVGLEEDPENCEGEDAGQVENLKLMLSTGAQIEKGLIEKECITEIEIPQFEIQMASFGSHTFTLSLWVKVNTNVP